MTEQPPTPAQVTVSALSFAPDPSGDWVASFAADGGDNTWDEIIVGWSTTVAWVDDRGYVPTVEPVVTHDDVTLVTVSQYLEDHPDAELTRIHRGTVAE